MLVGVALVHQLVGSCDHLQLVGVVELFGDVLHYSISYDAEEEASATGTLLVPLNIVRVAPDEVTSGPFFWDFLDPGEGPDIVERLGGRREASMHTKYLLFDDGGEGNIVE